MGVFFIICMAFFLIYPLVPRKHIKWLLLALVLALSAMAFYAVPAQTDDLARYFNTLDTLREGGFQKLQTMIENGNEHWDTLPVCGYYFYFVSLFPDNGMLAATTIFLAYGSMLLVIWRAAQKYDVSKWYLFLACFFLLSTYWFYDIASGIRNGLAFTLFCAIAYFDIAEKKAPILCWIGYILLLGLHSSAIILLFIRIAVLLATAAKGNRHIISVATFFAMIVGGALVPKLGELTGIEYFELISEKAERAVDSSGGYSGTSYAVNVSVFLVALLVSIYCIYVINRYKKFESFEHYKIFVIQILSFMLGSIFFGLTFLRFARWIIPAVISVFFMVSMQAGRNIASDIQSQKKKKSIIKSTTMVSSNEILINFLFIAYTCVHFWYQFAGSSLRFLHFS